MTPARFTRFPYLFSSRPIGTGDQLSQSSVDVAVETPLEILVVSWALLLRFYTEEVAPTFKVHGSSVTVEISDWAAPVVSNVTVVEGERFTGIVDENEPELDGCDLLFRYERKQPGICLVSSRWISSSQLLHIAKQLAYIAEQRLQFKSRTFSWQQINESELSIVNKPARKLAGPQLLHQLLDRHAGSLAPALEYRRPDGEHNVFSFKELHDRSDRLAARVRFTLQSRRQMGDPERDIIPLLIPQCPELYITILAILKAGAAFCPLHLDAPVERIKFIVEDVAARLIITTSTLRNRIAKDESLAVIIIDDISEAYDDVEVVRQQTCKPTNLAYVMYTSGSTGQPKGVGISHMSASQALLAHKKHIPSFRRFLQFAAPTFDVFVFEMFFPLYKGKTLVSCNRTELLTDLPAMINRLDVDAAELTPTVVATLIRKRSHVPHLKVLLTIGEMLTHPVIAEFGDSPSTEGILHGMYGPTEATIHCTLATEFSSLYKVGIIGVPLDTVSCFIIAPQESEGSVSRDMDILPIGQVGELAIAGIQLADGYINRPEQTDSAFLETGDHGRIYRTGDKARLLPGGVLECLGRISAGQVKLRGQRIELGEIEQVAYQTDGIRSANAAVISGIIVLFCVTDKDDVTPNDILESCRRWLPAFIVPGDVVLLKDVPRLSSGKVDTAQLKADYEQAKSASTSAQQTQLDGTGTEIRRIILNILGVWLDGSANLTTAGLESLAAIRLAAALRSANINVSVVDVLKANTIQGIAEISRSPGTESRLPESAILTDEWTKVRKNAFDEMSKILPAPEINSIYDIIPCTPLQVAMLAETKVDHQAYCNWIELECAHAFKPKKVQAALIKLANENEILRTGFAQSREQSHPFVQVIWNSLQESQVVQSSSLNLQFQISTTEEFLRPLRVLVRNLGTKTHLVVQIHHALYDGWSWELLINDLDMILRNQTNAPRPQFREVVKFYTHPSAAARSGLSRQYWQNLLQNVSSCTLPNLHGRINVERGLRAAHATITTPLADIESTSRSLGVSPQAVFQAAFAWLLSVYIGSSDIIFGTVSSGRTLPVIGIDEIIGPCIATLPVRVDVGHARTGQDLIQTVHRLTRQMLEHHELPLRDIKKTCGIGSRDPLFDTMLIWQQTSQDRHPEILTQVSAADHLEFNLSFEVEPRGSTFHVKANYQRTVLPELQINLFLRQMDGLITSLIRDPFTPLTDLGHHLDEGTLSIENQNPTEYDSEGSLSRSVEDLAQHNPTLTAIEFVREIKGSNIKVERISYRSLNRRANQVAHYLLKQNVSPDDLVCICMNKSVDLYIGILGIIKAGAGYLPLTPETPMKRRQNILTESKVTICLSHSHLLEQGEDLDMTNQNGFHGEPHLLKTSSARRQLLQFPTGIKLLYLDQIGLSSMPVSNPSCEYRLSNLAYAVFTSGTTGVSKGVLVTQGNLLSNLRALSDIYPVPQGSRLLQSCSQAFDVSVFEIFFAWFTGMCLCSATQDVLFRDLEHSIRAMRITHLSLTPTVAALVDPLNVPLVKFLVTAGEAVTDKVFKNWSGKGLFQGYGPSETTNICTVKQLVVASDNINNIGPPLPNTSAFVLQGPSNLALAVKGAVGEFCFGGDQVFRGYLNMPSLNAQKIINHPKFGRLYRSGDYGRILSDGSLEYFGRQDDQVKVRGQRVELGEINNLLLRSPKITDAVTFVDQTKSTTQRLLTFWVPKGHSHADWRILSDTEAPKPTIIGLFFDLISNLPAYMIPALLVPISSIPMTSQGKVDKRRLVQALSILGRDYNDYVSRPLENGSDDQEWTGPETKIASILCGTIECMQKDIGRSTSFFSLGLDSISAVAFSRSLREEGFHEAEASTVLRNPTVLALGKKLTQASQGNLNDKGMAMNVREVFDSSDIRRISRRFEESGRHVSKILPCTPLQEAMLSSLGSGTTNLYYNHTIFEIHGDIDRLRDAWQKMVIKHDILRTSFTTTENGRYAFAQVIVSSHQLDWTVLKVADKNLDAAIDRRMEQATKSSKDYDALYSFTTFQTSSKTLLLLSMHHALYDGEAIQLLLGELQEAYESHDSEPDTEPAIPFEPFLELALSLDLDKADSFWNSYLGGFEPQSFPIIPSSTPVTQNKYSEADLVSITSSINLSSIENYCRTHSFSLLGITQSSWAKLLSLYLGKADVCFGNVVSGRTVLLDGVDRIVAPCFNTLPVRFKVIPSMSNMEFVKNTQQRNFEALSYQFTPLRRIQRLHFSNASRLFDTLFILQKSQTSLDNHIWSVNKDIGTMDLPFVCEIIPFKDRDILQLNLHTNTSGIESHAYALTILKTLDAIMQACLQFPSATITDFGFLDKDLHIQAADSSKAAKMGHHNPETHAPNYEDLKSDTKSQSQWTSDEREILAVLTKLSNVKRQMIGLQTTIFRLGLDSISAVQIAAHLRERGRKLSPLDILEHPTIGQLALHLQSREQTQKDDQEWFDFESFDESSRSEVCLRHNISKSDLESVRPCTPVQSGILASFIHSKGLMYFNSMEMQVPQGDHTLGALQKAWRSVVAKHEMLRTGFSNVKDPHYPFAMLTYHKNVLDPVVEAIDEKSPENINALRKQTKVVSNDVIGSLHLPPWRLVAIRKHGNSWTIRLFILHALFDAISLSYILSDLTRSYRGENLATKIPVAPLLNSILIESAGKIADKRSFWRELLKEVPVTKFPTTTALHVKSSETYALQKPCKMSLQEIQRSCRDIGVTVQSAGQASWARLLSMYTGESSVIFGSVFSGRTNLETTGNIAFPSIVTLPICACIDGSNRELLDSFMRISSSLLKHQFTPLSKIQRWTDHVDEPLFDTIFVYQDIASQKTSVNDLWKVVNETATADYPISVELIPSDAVLQLRLVAKENVLPREQARILLEQLEATLVDTILYPGNTSTDTGSYPNSVLSITPAKEPSIPSQITLLHQFVETQAKNHPHRVALEFATSLAVDNSGKRKWTYRELNTEGNEITALLSRNGIRPRSMIAICFRKCPEASFATLGILKAGCCFVAIDPDAPISRQEFIVQDSDCSCVFATKDTAECLQGKVKVPVIALDELGASFSTTTLSKPNLGIQRELRGSDLCYCLYTSGTTGTPKACLITHENAVQAMLSFQRLFDGHWDVDSRFLQFASFHFDVSVLEQYWSWSVGICVTSAPRDLIFEDISAAIRALGITHLDLTPSLAKTLHPDDVPSLCKGVFITGGEQLQQEILDVWGSKGCIYNGYGPTETTIGNTMYPRVPINGKHSNIGQQFDNVGTYVFRVGTTTPVLRGAVGELCVAGKLVSPGYLNQPQLNEQKFPYLESYGERIYRTGDLVRIFHDNTFDFLGRADDQVKLRGQRLEVAEINQVIKRGVDQVRDVATLALKHVKSQRMQLVSFFVPVQSKSRGSHVEVLKEHDLQKVVSIIKETCQEKLPPYMVPTHCIPVSGIPLSTNNKIESKKLKALYDGLSSLELQNLIRTQDESQDVWSDIEERIINHLAKATDSEANSITRNSSIFRLGLDSISVVSFARTLKEAGFPNAQVSVVMQNPIVGHLFNVLTGLPQRQNTHSSEQLLARQNIEAFRCLHLSTVCRELELDVDEVEALALCTPLQDGIISRSLSSNTPLYFEEFCFELLPDVKIHQLRLAWNKVMTSTQVLRTKFCPTRDGYAQTVLKNMQLPWHEEYFVTEEELHKSKFRHYNAWHAENRELGGRMYEILILHSGTKKLMCLHIFHALYDGISLPMILQKVTLEYSRARNITYGPPFLETLAFGPLCEMDGAKEFWVQRLGGLTYQPLQTSTASFSRVTSSATFEISHISINDIRRRHNTTHQSLIQAAWIKVFRKYFPSAAAFGMVISGRSIDFEDVDKTMGPLFNTIPFYVDIEACTSWADVIKRCHEFNTAVLPYQHSSLRDITKWCRRSPEHPLFETLFVFQKEVGGNSLNGCQLWTRVETEPRADYPISFEALLLEDEDVLRLTIVAQSGVSSEDKSMKILQDFADALSEIATDSSKLLLDASGLSRNTQPATPGDDPMSKEALLVPRAISFQWSPNARAIRNEISLLAECEVSTLTGQSSIFALGLDSIDVVKLSSRLKRHSINLSVGTIMRNTTIAEMAQLADTSFSVAQDNNAKIDLERYEAQLSTSLRSNGLLKDTIEVVLPPTPLQEAMFADMSMTSSSRYFNQDVLCLEPSIDVKRMELAWTSVIARSPILRTSFVAIDDPSIPVSYAQAIHRPGTPHIRKLKLSPKENSATVIQTAMNQDREAAFDDVPVRLTFILGIEKSYLILSMSHALYDGWSLSLLHSDVLETYHNRYSPRPSYRRILEHILNSSGSEASRYWTDYISGAKCCSFPQREGQLQSRPQVHRLERNSAFSTSDIKAFVKRQRITPQALGQTCWALVLGSYLKSLEVVFGVVLSGRDTEEANQVMFPTMNTIVVRSIIHGSFKQMLQNMQESCANAAQYQHFPLRKVQAAARKTARKLFDSIFILQMNSGLPATGEKLYDSIGGDSSVEFPVCVEMELGEKTILWRIACENTIFDSEGAENIVRRLESVLERLVQAPIEPTIKLTEEGMAICDLPAFEIGGEVQSEERSSYVDTFESSSIVDDWTDIESAIRKILSDVSHVPEEEITKEQTIFHIGLDSISAIKVSALLRNRSMILSVGEMLKAASIPQMASMIDGKLLVTSAVKVDSKSILFEKLANLPTGKILQNAGINLDNVERTLPCSSGQVYMLSTWENSGGIYFYPTFQYETIEHLDESRLTGAWKMLCKKSPILRTAFTSTGDTKTPFLQVVFKENQNPIIWLSEPPSDDALNVQHNKPFISLGVLASKVNTPTGSAKTDVFLKIHHALYDGVSLNIIVHQLQDLYHSPDAKLQNDLQFEDFLAYGLKDSIEDKRRNFWSSYLELSGNPLVPLAEFTVQASSCKRVSYFQPSLIPSTTDVFAAAKRHGISIQALFFSAYARVHASLLRRMGTSTDDIIFGIYLANRSLPLEGLSTLASPTMNLVPLRVRNALRTTIFDSAQNIQRDLHAIGNAENSGVGLWEVLEWTGVQVDCFVNFLSLPGALDDQDVGRKWAQVNHLDPDNEKNPAVDRMTTSEDSTAIKTTGFATPLSNAVALAYRESIDVEAAIREDGGGLDVGIWFPERLKGSAEVGRMMEELRGELRGALNGDSSGL